MVDLRMLKAKMAYAGYSQRMLAAAIGVNKDTLNMKLNGKRDFDTTEIMDICNVLGIEGPEEKCAIFLSKSSHNRDDQW